MDSRPNLSSDSPAAATAADTGYRASEQTATPAASFIASLISLAHIKRPSTYKETVPHPIDLIGIVSATRRQIKSHPGSTTRVIAAGGFPGHYTIRYSDAQTPPLPGVTVLSKDGASMWWYRAMVVPRCAGIAYSAAVPRALRLPKRRLKRSTRPLVSAIFCLPV